MKGPNFPPELKMAFGLERMDPATMEGYFGLCFYFCQLCLAIQAANYGLGLVSVEEAELTADFLLTKPLIVLYHPLEQDFGCSDQLHFVCCTHLAYVCYFGEGLPT